MIGKAKAFLDNKGTNDTNILIFKYLKHNILSVVQMIDRGHEVTFNSRGSRTRKEDSRKLVEKGIMALDNIYVLKERKCINKGLKAISFFTLSIKEQCPTIIWNHVAWK